ncbi:MAG: hypothetical protein WCD70_09835 [Alphaproteobacteria bacterium]
MADLDNIQNDHIKRDLTYHYKMGVTDGRFVGALVGVVVAAGLTLGTAVHYKSKALDAMSAQNKIALNDMSKQAQLYGDFRSGTSLLVCPATLTNPESTFIYSNTSPEPDFPAFYKDVKAGCVLAGPDHDTVIPPPMPHP